jgi:fructose-1,6-bisphosphatase I
MVQIGQTLTQFITDQQRSYPQAKGELSGLLVDIAQACQAISVEVERVAINQQLGEAGSQNIQGESQKKLDVICNEIMIDYLKDKGHLAGMVSEENEAIISMPIGQEKAPYLICFDPLDGSSNIDINLSVGTIFSILRFPIKNDEPTEVDFLQTGTQQVAAGFCVYGPSTVLVLTLGRGVHAFTLDRTRKQFVLTHVDMSIPEDTAEFAINMSNQRFWPKPMKRYIAECIQGEEGPRMKNFNMRWNASMVAEVYRLLCRGGIFMYPVDNRIADKGGKLRLMYEANPMSFIIEQAGGLSSTGYERIMHVEPNHIHQRVGVIMGSANEVMRVSGYYQEDKGRV